MEGTLKSGPRRAQRAATLVALSLLVACGQARPPGGADAPPEGALPWAEVLEVEPDPAIVVDPDIRSRLVATGLPWRVRDRASGVELLLVPPHALLRGAADDDPEASADERPAHAVNVVEPFYLGRYEVTQAEWRHVLGDAPSFFSGPPSEDPLALGRPVEQTAWFRVQEFLQQTGLALPTESQWEAACRAEGTAPRYGPSDEVAWHRGNAGGASHAVGTRLGNGYGFHDMLGNVWEWTSSAFREDEYQLHRAPLDARATLRGAAKAVLRGGSWYDTPRRARASARYAVERDFVGGHVGFRVLRVP